MKNLFYTALGFIGIMGTLSLGVVNAQETCGSGYVENAAGTGCELVKVTFDAYGGNFSDDETIKIIEPSVIEVPPIRYSHTANINDEGVASSVYDNNLSTNDVVTIPGATSLDIEVRFATQGASYDWLAIYPAGITPTAYNYSSATISNGKLAGRGSYTSYTKPNDTDTTYHRNFTTSGDTAQFYFKSNASTAYYGYYAIVKGIGGNSGYECMYNISTPSREGYFFDGWYADTGYTQKFNNSECLPDNTTIYAKWYESRPKNIKIEATATSAGQTLKINKYFANAYTVNWGDGNPVENLTADTIHTYTGVGTYTIILSLSGAYRWTFQDIKKPLIPRAGTTMIGVRIISMPSLASGFGNDAAAPGDYFFSYFNQDGLLTGFLEGSFDTSNITTAGNYFFSNFNYNGFLESLPENSFDTSNITTAGNYFFSSFNEKAERLESLPEKSFDISNIMTVGDYFFSSFDANHNRGGIKNMPAGSFKLSTGLTTVGNYFFQNFNYRGGTENLATGSFDISNITAVGDSFFAGFNYMGQLKSLPRNSFRLSTGLTTVGNYFFMSFNCVGSLTGLSDGSFDTSNITTVGDYFFYQFNHNGKLKSLPRNSFRLSTGLTKVGVYFFSHFNYRGELTNLPEGSFDASNITTAGYSLFNSFNSDGKITTLPDSFKLTSVAYNKSNTYQDAFNTSSYTINRKVSDLVAGITVPTADRDTFSDNQPGRCGVHANRLVTPADACSISYDDGQGGVETYKYNADTTGVVVGSGIELPIVEGYSYEWYDESGNKIEKIMFPNMDGKTLYVQQVPIIYKIDYKLNDGVTSGENITGYTIESQNITLINPTKIGYTFTGWSGADIDGFSGAVVIPSGSTGDRNYEANWQINQYTITFDTDGGTNIPSITADYGTGITAPANPTKNGYTFKGWDKEIPTTMPAENITIKAKWEKVSGGSSGGGGGGGGGGGSSSSKEEQKPAETPKDQASSGTTVKEPETNTGNKAEIQTGNVVDTPEKAPENDNPAQDTTTNNQQGQNNTQRGGTYSTEFQEAYEFAHEKGITTMPTIEKANMDGKLTRIAMAKMLSQYAMNVLGQKPDEIINNKFNDVTDKQNSDYDDGVTLAYQLGIMGQNMPGNNFRPTDEVTRAEFATALSRMLYNTSDGEYKSTSKYYTHHMEKLVKEGIITKDDPAMKELRGYVMIMLMRSAK